MQTLGTEAHIEAPLKNNKIITLISKDYYLLIVMLQVSPVYDDGHVQTATLLTDEQLNTLSIK